MSKLYRSMDAITDKVLMDACMDFISASKDR